MSFEVTEDFVLGAASRYTGADVDVVQEVMTSSNNGGAVAGIDPMLIIAVVELLTEIIPMLLERCSDEEELIQQSRIRNRFAIAIFRARVRSCCIDCENCEPNYRRFHIRHRKLADAILDEAHNRGTETVAAMVKELQAV